jgi:hypothetical protein
MSRLALTVLQFAKIPHGDRSWWPQKFLACICYGDLDYDFLDA